ncbi:hypothetical protein LMG19083_00649 [Ralstonia psammae]|uniref:Uncharacterized protein n=1 Tax=Ralstonia psammae TaxID=3058598 RepID=A0ABM9J2F5_9RALS|nr:hypothetical protein LMG19083_00649 [Ralstonia sp. LMG 19083]CAJ0821960.1 hypothetical protein LMG19087_04613 [Ralstonia wenshanensis]
MSYAKHFCETRGFFLREQWELFAYVQHLLGEIGVKEEMEFDVRQ